MARLDDLDADFVSLVDKSCKFQAASQVLGTAAY